MALVAAVPQVQSLMPQALPKKKKNKILPFATVWMDLEGIILIEISQTEKGKFCLFIFYGHTSSIWKFPGQD